jgi:hypothetical protein
MSEYTGGQPLLLRHESLLPHVGEGLRIYGHVNSAIPSWGRGDGRRGIEPVGGEWLLLFFVVVSGIRDLVMEGK